MADENTGTNHWIHDRPSRFEWGQALLTGEGSFQSRHHVRRSRPLEPSRWSQGRGADLLALATDRERALRLKAEFGAGKRPISLAMGRPQPTVRDWLSGKFK